jgi:beta-barrel assembly-enhancing protease
MRTLIANLVFFVASAILLTASSACDKNNNINLLSLEDDKKLGAQTEAQIAADPAQFPLLARDASSAQAYAYLDAMRTSILNSGKLTYRDDFVWKMYIIKDDNTLNAFCTPGGYIYMYTGLIKFLDKADDLAGVLGHEMGHADLRHTSRQITQQQGYQFVLDIVLGQNASGLAQIATQLKDLKYSRTYETEADAASVKYLSGTSYACNGAATFFEKLIAQGQSGSTPVFLSTHPSPETRVADINASSTKLNCSTSPINEGANGYAAFKASLP